MSTTNTALLGDAREILKSIPDESFHLTFTSPPYFNAKDYSSFETYEEYLKMLEEVFFLTHQKTKEGRFLVVNTSPVLVKRTNRMRQSKRHAIPFDLHGILIKQGWNFIDDIIWLKPEASVKNRNGNFFQNRKPLAYKPNVVNEYVMVYRKYTHKLIDWNIRQYDKKTIAESKVEDGYETSNVWKISPRYSKHHPAIFPDELCEKIIRYYSYKGDLIFDPFAGSGTVGKVAKKLDRKFFLCEKSPEYYSYINININSEKV